MTMNRKIALALALTAAAAANAYAEAPLYDNVPTTSTASRAQVQAELAQFQQSGVNPSSSQYNPLRHTISEQSRDGVRAEFVDSRDLVEAFTGEDSGSAYLARGKAVAPAATRLDGQANAAY